MSNVFLMLGAKDPTSHVVPHHLFEAFGVSITNHHLMGLVAAVLVFLVFSHVGGRSTPRGTDAESYVTKGRLAQLFEVLAEFIRENVVRPNLGSLTDKYIYYIWSVFFFILFANVLGMIPFGALFALVFQDDSWAHWGGTATSNLAITGAMATISLCAIVGIGVHEQGLKYFAHFAPVPFTPVAMAPLALFLVVLEVMGLLIKCTVLAVRLFGTMMAGHLVVAAVLALITGWAVGGLVVVSLTLLNLLELFVAFLQAFIFTFLTTLFIAAGAVHHDDHGHEGATAAH
nr:F0F1 ATP synthase subunit A [Mucisphaera calidilacus]